MRTIFVPSRDVELVLCAEPVQGLRKKIGVVTRGGSVCQNPCLALKIFDVFRRFSKFWKRILQFSQNFPKVLPKLLNDFLKFKISKIS